MVIWANRVVLSRRAEMRSNVGVVTEEVGCSVVFLPRRSEIL